MIVDLDVVVSVGDVVVVVLFDVVVVVGCVVDVVLVVL